MTAAIVVLLALFMVLQVADAWLTDKILKRGGRELNPVMRWLMDLIGRIPALALVKLGIVAFIAAAIWVTGAILAWLLALAIFVAVMVCVVANNWRQLK